MEMLRRLLSLGKYKEEFDQLPEDNWVREYVGKTAKNNLIPLIALFLLARYSEITEEQFQVD